MDIHFDCPACGGSLVAEVRLIGESIACPHCSKWIRVPTNREEELPSQSQRLRNVLNPVLEQELHAVRFQLRKAKVEYTHLEGLYRRSEEERKKAAEGHATSTSVVRETTEVPTNRLQIGKEQVAHSAELEAARKLIAQLQTDLENAQNELHKAQEKSKTAAENEEKLKAILAKANNDLAVSEKQLAELRVDRAKETSKLSRDRVRAEALEEERNKSLNDLINERKEHKETSAKLDALQQRENELQKATAELEQQTKKLADEKNALIQEKNTLANEREKIATDLQKTITRVEELQNTTKQYEQQLAAANDDQARAKQALEKTIAELDRLHAEREMLIKERNQAHTDSSRFKGQLEALRISHDELKSAHENAQNDLKNALSGADQNHEQLEATLQQLHENLDHVMKEIAERRSKAATQRLST